HRGFERIHAVRGFTRPRIAADQRQLKAGARGKRLGRRGTVASQPDIARELEIANRAPAQTDRALSGIEALSLAVRRGQPPAQTRDQRRGEFRGGAGGGDVAVVAVVRVEESEALPGWDADLR